MKGTYSESALLGPVAISQQTFDASFARPQDVITFVNVRGDASAAQTKALERALTGFPDADVQTKSTYVENREGEFSTFLNVVYGLLALSVVVSLFGMVNTLVLSVFERTRELGMLRAVGMTRRQARRMVRHESVITALIGAALGMPLGIFLAGLVTLALRDEGLKFSLPASTLARVRAHRRRGGHPRRDSARAAGVPAKRARGAPVRVTDPIALKGRKEAPYGIGPGVGNQYT